MNGRAAGRQGGRTAGPAGLPMVLGVLLLAGLLAGCGEGGVRPTTSVVSADTADQILEGASQFITENGVRRGKVEADTARIYNQAQVIRLRNLKVTFYDDQGSQTSVITADSGVYQVQTGAMQAEGHVVGTSDDGRVLHTSVLRYDQAANKISTDQHFTVDGNGDHWEGEGFTSDPDFTHIVVQRPTGQEGGSRLLPGQ